MDQQTRRGEIKTQTVEYQAHRPINMIGRCNTIWTDDLGNHGGEGEARVFHVTYGGLPGREPEHHVLLGMSDRWVDDLAASAKQKESLGGCVLTPSQARAIAGYLIEGADKCERIEPMAGETDDAPTCVEGCCVETHAFCPHCGARQ